MLTVVSIRLLDHTLDGILDVVGLLLLLNWSGNWLILSVRHLFQKVVLDSL